MYDVSHMAQLYQELPHHWLLLEVLETNEHGRAEKLRLLKYAKDKNELYEYLLDEDPHWEWSKRYIFVFSDPEKECEIP
ncbi:MAG: hypothetical protein IPG32_17645 [Saprospirales bacterium]|nr:hypothetical protein [Saprospirales bacterium]